MSEVGIEKITEKVHCIHDRLRTVKSLMTEIMRDITWVESTLDRRIKPKVRVIDDASVATENSCCKRSSGLTIPVPLSDTMCEFMGVEHGSKESRVAITREVNAYIKKHSLQDVDDKRLIHPDETLAILVGTTEPFHFFQLQSLLKHHYVKNDHAVRLDEDGLPLSELTDDGN